MNIVARISAADGYGVVLPALLAMLLALAGPDQAPGQNDVPKSPAADAEAPFEAQLDALHEKARRARDEEDFSQVEELRLERLALAKDSSGKSAWIAGAQAIAEADALIQSMQYEKACTVLQKAWKPFEKPARGEAVFGDVAMKLFEAVQAALAVYPDFKAVPGDVLRKAVQLAADGDPCQVEAQAADAFLTVPNPDEAFQPAELRPSLRLRNKRLLAISHAADRDERPLPWHAPVEFLKAESSSFVLDDLRYYDRFLNPRRRLRGLDAYGEPVHLVMGGTLLVVDRDTDGRRRPAVADYDVESNDWLRMTPRILRIEPPAFRPQPWRLDEAKLNADLREIIQDSIAERQTLIRRRLLVSAEGLKGATKVKAHISRMLGWINNPPKDEPAPKLEDVLQMVSKGYDKYSRNFPEEAERVQKALATVQQSSTEWSQFQAQLEGLRAATGDTNAATSVDATKAATALVSFLALIEKDNLALLELPEPEIEPADKADKAEKADKAPPKLAATAGPIQLSGRELRLKLSRQKDQYDLLAFFQLMNSSHRPPIQSMVANLPAPDATPPPGAPPPSAEEQARTAALARLAGSLEQYDAIRDKSTREAPPRGSEGPPVKTLSLSLDGLVQIGSALRDMAAALRALGNESDQTAFLSRFVATLDAVAKPAGYEAEIQRFCTKANLAQSWKLGDTTWSIYDFPREISPDKLADMIDHCQRVAFAVPDFEKAITAVEDDEPPSDTPVMLRPGCTTPFRNRLVAEANGLQKLRLLRDTVDPYTVLLLDTNADGKAHASPPGIDDGKGGRFFWLGDKPRGLKMSIVVGSGAKPELVVDYGGADGHMPLGASLEPFPDNRFMMDRRGNRIVRDRSKEASPTLAHFYAMTSKSGAEITDRSVNYVIQDWLDLDRNIVDAFLPDLTVHGPSLPGWRLYRSEFMRPAPDGNWKWAMPRRAFTLEPPK